MNYLFSLIIGIVLGAGDISVIYSASLILSLIFVYALKDVLIRKSLFTNNPSPYVLYIEKTKHIGNSVKNAWLSYILQSLLVDGLIAFIAFFVVRFLF